jgi:ribosomal protein L37E
MNPRPSDPRAGRWTGLTYEHAEGCKSVTPSVCAIQGCPVEGVRPETPRVPVKCRRCSEYATSYGACNHCGFINDPDPRVEQRSNEAVPDALTIASNQRDHFKGLWDTSCAMVAELCKLAGADPERPQDLWTLHDAVEKLTQRGESPSAEEIDRMTDRDVAELREAGRTIDRIVDRIAIEAIRQELQIDHYCAKCGYRLVVGDMAMCAVASLRTGSILHAIRLAWCDGCWSTYAPPPCASTEQEDGPCGESSSSTTARQASDVSTSSGSTMSGPPASSGGGPYEDDVERAEALARHLSGEDNEVFVQIVLQLIDDVRDEEREACARVCADYADDYREKAEGTSESLLLGAFRHRTIAACDCEVAIRARSTHPRKP